MEKLDDADIGQWLDTLFGHSEPGAAMHHLLLAVTGPAGRDALGLPAPAEIEVTICAIAPVNESARDAEDFVTRAIGAAIIDTVRKGSTIHFAGLAMENLVATGSRAEMAEAQRTLATGGLENHPGVIEATHLYAAARDGRRWAGVHLLTGPEAGRKEGPTLHTGPLLATEHSVRRAMLRAAVRHPAGGGR